MKRADGRVLTPGTTIGYVGFSDRPAVVRQYQLVITNGQGQSRIETIEATNFRDMESNIPWQDIAPDDVIQSVNLINDGSRQAFAQ